MAHEGDKAVIYRYIESGVLKVADSCDFDHCKANDLWPVYIDSEGLDTVGVGHLVTHAEPYNCYVGLSDEHVYSQLSTDITSHLLGAQQLAERYQMAIAGNFVVQRFMTEMCFNIGASAYSYFKQGLKKLTSAVNHNGAYTYNQAADEHLDSKWARQVKGRAIAMVDTLRALD